MDAPIEKLSEDVLLEIFEFLDARSLKKAALVCKNWNNLVSSSPSTLKKFTLKLSHVCADNTFWADRYDDIMRFERKFQSMAATLYSVIYCDAAKLFVNISCQHGSQIRNLSISEAEFQRFEDFSEILSNMPLLEEFEIRKTKLNFAKDRKLTCIKPVALKRLKVVKIVNSNWSIFQYLIGAPVTNLTLTSTMIRPERPSLISFLEQNEHLESLHIDYKAYSNIFQVSLAKNLPFKLKKLKCFLFTYSTEVDQIDLNFTEFLESQSASLEELELNYATHDVLKVVFSKLKSLKKLRINSVSLPREKKFYDHLNPIKSLKELEVHDEVPNGFGMGGLLGNCPNLVSLKAFHDLNGVISNILPFISLHNPKLKSLSIESLNVLLGPEVKFDSLEYLHCQHLGLEKYLLSFLRNNASIHTLSVGSVKKKPTINKLLTFLMAQPNMKHLKFGGSFDAMKAIYDKIKVDYKKLKSLELSVSVGSESYWPALVFKFPADVSKWNPRCIYFDSFVNII